MSKMFEHRRVHRLLYEYVRNETMPGEDALVEKHIARCSRCASELEDLQKGFHVVPSTGINPADDLPEEFWLRFVDEVDRRIDDARPVKKPSFREEWDAILSFLVARQRWVVGLSGAVASIVVVLLIVNPFNSPTVTKVKPVVAEPVQPRQDIMQVNSRAGDYFRKSQALLVGISNMRIENNRPVDFSAEQQLSRELVHEARYLKQQPLDYRSVKVVGDVEKILIQLANAGAHQELPDFELIRAGIHQENLLFKLRMAESIYDTAHFGSGNISRESK